LKKNIFISNTCLSIIIGIIDSTRVILSSKVSKAALDTILFIISTISLYLIVFTIISLIAYLVHKLSPSSIKSIFSLRRIQFFLDTVAIIGLLAFYMTSEPVRIEGSDKTRVANSTIKDYPNILLITVDTLRYDHLSSTGYPEIETPNIDQLSKNGITFTDDNCQIPVTTPSHSSIFTGFNPYIHGSRFNGTPINKKIKTITEYLKDIGYETAAFVSSSTLKSRLSGLNKGFDVYDQFLCPSRFDQRI
jgi:glucan phosphoethanolaminetransferase (alkaline phosphatase superfamily)